ncbi:Protein CURVATURE THYLAKOID 1A [Arabidopsis thaliana]|uniref:Protein CURVATURE THYLAKOID 1A, chloroplastic n=3 Tax=Arabidopsis TaxID=3701 RepID=CUT1A_ARATH|nr:CURVATURE THYLAKOID 1A-like protein [Arabidopsis thaliana]O04616.1 RecName: Full=Protein CURVATURE THYLAKOID 1A, chloroplastic; Flags: Precursor [Arabidopsis thaliana]KAG7614727.1 Cyanobacterial aminoacyl-tRNA synthetase CAAD domain [Arabidopsis thaliana x Arabidopsis arenosa]AAB61025.1 A_IG002N01.18 gene product [Arabidopsis thaliana]AAK63864.1 AT4g01150/F2N1_18 [Arabidopsis thaliana]AAM10278.1 AT4g01150/F2N1_18 [Arabidopsis thaliana]AEE81987.1 CURVATURE THYLAKOID 1A-like protein [Arabido|eukprot:NP_567210.1 CURVATURE THYLAKOID 1A-like protein [Arabidopsis thaliana]
MAISVAASSSMAVMVPRVPAVSTRCSAVPYLPPRSFGRSSFTVPLKLVSGNGLQKVELLKTRASSEETSSIDTNELITDLKEKWDGLENKSTVLIYGGGAIVAVWLSSIVVGAINSVPLLPKVMELVGLGYTGWFVYRYLLFKSSRKELAEDIESLKKKIAGSE